MPVAPRWITTAFLLSALAGGVPGLAATVDPAGAATLLGLEPPPDLTAARVWGVLALLVASLCASVARDPVGAAPLAQYVWPTKAGIALAVALGVVAGDTSPRLLGWVVVSDAVWIPALMYADYLLRNPLLPRRR